MKLDEIQDDETFVLMRNSCEIAFTYVEDFNVENVEENRVVHKSIIIKLCSSIKKRNGIKKSKNC